MEYGRAACLQAEDPLTLLEIGLERYQAETKGQHLISSEDIASICDSLWKKQDVLIRNKGNYIDIIEMRCKRKDRDKRELRDWQREIMEQDAGRSGSLPGDT